jgi:hypothetical protein
MAAGNEAHLNDTGKTTSAKRGLPLLFAGPPTLCCRPGPLELLKKLMLGAAFLLWGVVQLMPASDLETELGNLVIALYVFDLELMIWIDQHESAHLAH